MTTYLSMEEAKLPPGFRFHPRDDELICDYLVPMVDDAEVGGSGFIFYGRRGPTMVIVDLNKCEPWDLPATARVGDNQWYFFSLHDRKYASGPRTNRATKSGYWKATGKDRSISRKGVIVGMRKTLVFYGGRAPKGNKTEWVMHEFRSEGTTTPRTPNPQLPFKEEWVLCRVFCKSRRGISGQPSNSMETSHDDTAGSPLMEEDNYINFEDQPPTDPERFQQVPCFSSNTSQEPTLEPHLQAPMEIRSFHSLTSRTSPLIGQHFGTLPELSSDNKALNQYLSKLQEGNDTKVEAPNATYTAAESGLPSPWSDLMF